MSGFSLDSPLRFLQAEASPGSSERGVKSALSRDLLAVASMDEAEVLAHLGSSLEGLNSAEAALRLARNGPNLVAQNGAPNHLQAAVRGSQARGNLSAGESVGISARLLSACCRRFALIESIIKLCVTRKSQLDTFRTLSGPSRATCR